MEFVGARLYLFSVEPTDSESHPLNTLLRTYSFTLINSFIHILHTYIHTYINFLMGLDGILDVVGIQ